MKLLSKITILVILNLAMLMAIGPVQVSARASDDLDKIILSISSDQVVGVPLIGTPQILLHDSLTNPVVDYDLATYPITLSISEGQLVPSLLNNNTFLTNGVIDLELLDITFTGLSGPHTLTAANETINSSGLIISFNGYDIHSVFDITGNPVTTVYAGLPTNLNVAVKNGGNMTASTNPYIKAFFTSDVSGSVKRYFSPASNGTNDTIQFLLENTIIETGEDTLILLLESKYEIGGTIYPTVGTVEIPITVLNPATFTVASESTAPDSIYAGSDFNFSFDVETVDFAGPVDSTYLSINLVKFEGGPVLANIFSGALEYSDWSGTTLIYDSIPALLDSVPGLPTGDYLISMDYQLISGANVFSLSNQTQGSLTVLGSMYLEYLANTLQPRIVIVDKEIQFSFDMEYFFVDDASSMLELDASTSIFEIYSSSFSTQTNLVFENDTLPNNNHVGTASKFRVSTGMVTIPQEQLGELLNARASFHYKHLQLGNYLTFVIEFASEPIALVEYPRAQIIAVKPLAYNPTRVNTDQSFQLEVLVASQSNTSISDLQLLLSSDGNSLFDSITIVPEINPFDTVAVSFDITASDLFGTIETFKVEIKDTAVIVMPAIDANATLSIDSPADVMLMCELSSEAQDSLLEQGESFSLMVSYTNSGSALISQVPFTFSTDGIDLGVPLMTEGLLQNDTNLIFLMTAPELAANINLTFNIASTPIDQNSGLPAPINKLSSVVTIEVASTQATLSADINLVGEVLLIPGTTVPVLDLVLTNSGTSARTDMMLNSLIVDISNQNFGADSYIVESESGFFENDFKLGQAKLGLDKLEFTFDNFIIEAGQSRVIQLILKLQDELPGSFTIELDQNSFVAEFLDENLAGQPITVESPTGSPVQFDQGFQSTGNSTEESFVIETNPFNPNLGPVDFAYILTEPSEVVFRIFTLTGDLVHEKVLSYGTPGTEVSSIPHMIAWDGTNDTGQIVLNGIYIAHLAVSTTGTQAIIKVAVVK